MSIRERKRNRLKEYDYSGNGYYFITICTKQKQNFFGNIKDHKVILNPYGKIAFQYWQKIPKHFKNCRLDEFIIMPNHIHGIIIIDKKYIVGNNDRCSLQPTTQSRNMEILFKIISQYKSSVTRYIRKYFYDFDFAWQKSFYDRVIRNEKELLNIRFYIHHNPLKHSK